MNGNLVFFAPNTDPARAARREYVRLSERERAWLDTMRSLPPAVRDCLQSSAEASLRYLRAGESPKPKSKPRNIGTPVIDVRRDPSLTGA